MKKTARLVFGGVMTALALSTLAAAKSQAQRGPPIRTLTEQEVTDLMIGTGIQGTRSSNTEQMIRQARAMLAEGRQFRVVSDRHPGRLERRDGGRRYRRGRRMGVRHREDCEAEPADGAERDAESDGGARPASRQDLQRSNPQ